jgi:DNA (cytosine-5)-methyltransferase 1
MNYLSVCSGIEAATVAWHGLGWKPVGFSEIEKFPSQVLAHHYPTVTNFGDMTKYKDWNINDSVGLLVGGTPCQSFSVAGLRKGLEDPRGNLALTYVGILDRFRPKWCIWENVPGVLSSGGGRDFGAFLGALGELGYGFSYRVLDAQNFGVAQRRRRVFVVGHLGDWRPAAEVLFESESLSGNIESSRKTREKIAKGFVPSVANCLQTTCNDYSRADGFNMIAEPTISFDERNIQFFSNQNYQTCPTLTATDNKGAKGVLTPIHCVDTFPTLLSSTAGVSRPGNAVTEHQTYIAFGWQNSSHQGMSVDTITPTLDKSKTPAVFCDTYNGTIQGDVAATMTADMAGPTHSGPKVMQNMAVRRLTPVECERLQGFPDNYTNIPKAPDGNRYRALGNSMAVPVMKWIGERINEYERTNGRN